MSTPIHYTAINELSTQLRNHEISAVELVEHFIARVESMNDSLHAVITLAADEARQLAQEADRHLQSGSPTNKSLLGIPISVKDAIPTRGIRTTHNSRTKGDWIPTSEPLAISRLRDAGAIILAKANCNEYFGIPSDEDRYPRPRTPFNPDYVAIGSSSGSGVSVAAGLCTASICTDSAGSVRLPAAQAGAFGMKATNNLISRDGMGAASSFQVIGAITRSTADAALLTSIMSGETPTVLPAAPINGLRIGVPWHYIETSPVEPDILDAFREALSSLETSGAKIVDISIQGLAESRMATFVAMYTEHHAALAATTRNQLHDLGSSARLYAMQGAFINALDYLNALELGRRVKRNIDTAFDDVDVIAMPTSPFVTAEAARKPSEHRRGMNTVFTCPFNITGHPAITSPCGISSLNIPIGIQFAAPINAEAVLYQVSNALEQVTNWHEFHPNL